jgi:SAM-dependent methyltransferase
MPKSRVKAFERCGLVSLDDFEDPGYRTIFGHLEAVQSEYLSFEPKFRSPEYYWERDVLHGWSRSWEYPFAFYHITSWLERRQPAGMPSIIDLGSGVTYFPFALAREGCRVICIDNDPIAERDVPLSALAVSAAPGAVEFRLTNGLDLPFGDGEIDALYCISVLEHIEDPVPVIAEAARVMKPDALLVLTIDIDLMGNVDIGPEKYKRVMECLDERFERIMPERTIHPVRMLDTVSGPFPRPRARQIPGMMWRAATGKMLPFIGGPSVTEPTHLACYGAVMRRLP